MSTPRYSTALRACVNQHVAGYTQSQSLDQRLARLKACVLAAKARNDTATLATLKQQYIALGREING